MALPQQVIERLGREPPKTPGWSIGILLFSGGILCIALLTYFGLIWGYEPYLDSQIAQVNTQISTLAKSISADDQTKLVTFYSEIANLKSILANHVLFSHFLSWLEKNTEANIYYQHLTFSAGNQVVVSGIAKSEADVNQQMAIFEAAPEVKTVTLSGISLVGTTGDWQFNMSLVVDPAAVLRASQ